MIREKEENSFLKKVSKFNRKRNNFSWNELILVEFCSNLKESESLTR